MAQRIKSGTATVAARLPAEEVARLQRIAKARGVSLSEIVRSALNATAVDDPAPEPQRLADQAPPKGKPEMTSHPSTPAERCNAMAASLERAGTLTKAQGDWYRRDVERDPGGVLDVLEALAANAAGSPTTSPEEMRALFGGAATGSAPPSSGSNVSDADDMRTMFGPAFVPDDLKET